MSEESKAVQETAKAASKAGDILLGAGGWMANVLGTLPEDVIGLAGGDLIHEVRLRNLDRIKRRTSQILEARNVSADRQAVSPSVLIPLVNAAADESRPELQELFSRLLANALDPSSTERVRRSFIDIVKAMEPIDALLFKTIVEAPTFDEWVNDLTQEFPAVEPPSSSILKVKELATGEIDYSPDEVEFSLKSLRKLECAGDGKLEPWGKAGDSNFQNVWIQLRDSAAKERIDVRKYEARLGNVILTANIPITGRLLARALEL